MKSIKKLISFNNNKVKEKRDSLSRDSPEPKQVIEDESKETQDLREMRNQYEGLYSVSSVVSSRAADFSSAIQELATYFISTFGSIQDGEMSKVFKIVGRVQFELSKILDLYAVHITQTITEPTEMLLTELRNVQDSKRQHDEKRQLYEQLRTRMVKGKPKNGKAEAFADQQLQVVKEEFDKLSMFVNTRLTSLEQGQARTLITQAARHHTAQMNLFSRGHSSLQSVEPYMRQVARERNIDRQLSSGINGINDPDDDSDSKSEDDVSYIEEVDDSSDSQSLEQSNRWDSHVDTPGRSPNTQDEESGVPKNLSKEWSSLLTKLSRTNGENPHLRDGDISNSVVPPPSNEEQGSSSDPPTIGYSSTRTGPLSPQDLPFEQETIQVTELREEPKSPPRGLSYPSSPPSRPPPDIPVGMRGTEGVGSSTDLGSIGVSTSGVTSGDGSYSDADQVASGMQSDPAGVALKFTHSSVSSLDTFQPKFSGSAQKLPGPKPTLNAMEKPPVVTFGSPTLTSTPMGFTSNTKESRGQNLRRYSQSGPLTFNGSPWSSQPSVGNMPPSTPTVNSGDLHRSGPLGRSPLGRTFGSPRISPTMSPPRMSPPRISELHKLPPPPLNPINTRSARSPPVITHSAPLARHQDLLGNSLLHATPLPPPPLGYVSRSLSLPSRQKQPRSKAPSIAQVPEVSEDTSPTASQAQSALNNATTTRANGSSLTVQVQGVHKRVSSGNIPGNETGLPLSDLKFVHFNAAMSASGMPTLSSQQVKPPSPSARGGKDKAQQLDGCRTESVLHKATTPLKSCRAPNPSRWRSLSINDKDSYIQSIARASTTQREFSPELVCLRPT